MIVVIMHAIIMLRTCHREYRGITVGCCTGLDSGELGSRDFLYRILKCASNRGPRCIPIESFFVARCCVEVSGTKIRLHPLMEFL